MERGSYESLRFPFSIFHFPSTFIIWLVPVMAFLLDRATKAIARHAMVTSGTPIGSGILDTVVHENRGIIANLPLPLPTTIVLTAAIIIVVGGVWIRGFLRNSAAFNATAFRLVGLGLVLGGAVSNLFDRITLGFVYDWILLFGRAAVNAADIMIVFGAVLFLVSAGGLAGEAQTRARGDG